MQPDFGANTEHPEVRPSDSSQTPRRGRRWLWLATLLIVGTVMGVLGWRWYHYALSEAPQILREAAQAALQAEPKQRFDALCEIMEEYFGVLPAPETRTLLEQAEATIDPIQPQTPTERAQRRLRIAKLWVWLGETARGEQIALDTLSRAPDLAALELETAQFLMALPRQQPHETAEQWVEQQSQRFPNLRDALYQALWRAVLEWGDSEYAEQLMRHRHEPTIERLLQIVELHQRNPYNHRARPLLQEAEQLWRKRPTLQQGLQIASAYALDRDPRTESLLAELVRRYPNMTKREWLLVAWMSLERSLPLYTEAMKRVLERPDAETAALLAEYAVLFGASPMRREVTTVVLDYAPPAQQMEFLLQLKDLDTALQRAQQLGVVYKQPRLMDALVEAQRYEDALRLYGAHPNYLVAVRVAIAQDYLRRRGDVAQAHAMIEGLSDPQYADALYALLSWDYNEGILLALARHARLEGAERRAPRLNVYVRQLSARARQQEIRQNHQYGAMYREAQRIPDPAERARALMDVVSVRLRS